MIDNATNPNLTMVFKTADGTEFYGFTNPLSISASRGIAAEKAKRFIDMNITERSLRELIRTFKTEVKGGDLPKAFWIIQEIEFRLDMIAEDKSLLELACVYFLLKDEDLENPTNEANKRKHKIFETDAKARAFFLQIALSVVKKFSEKPEQDILTYLEDTKEIAERIRRYIPEESEIR